MLTIRSQLQCLRLSVVEQRTEQRGCRESGAYSHPEAVANQSQVKQSQCLGVILAKLPTYLVAMQPETICKAKT